MVFHYMRIPSTIHSIRHHSIRTDIDTHTPTRSLRPSDSSQYILRQLQSMPSCGRLRQPIGASTDRDQLLAVAHRDIHVVHQKLADLTRYLDLQSAHLATSAGAGDDSLPLMTVETFPRLPGGVRATLDSLQ